MCSWPAGKHGCGQAASKQLQTLRMQAAVPHMHAGRQAAAGSHSKRRAAAGSQ